MTIWIRPTKRALLASCIVAAWAPGAAAAQTGPAAVPGDHARSDRDDAIVVTGTARDSTAATKTDTPLIETPQPVTIIGADVYLAQGALSIADTLRYTAGVQTSAYGLDSRVDSAFIRGVRPLQYRDGMREVFGSYNMITSDPYNFARVEVLRGPASVLFGQGSLGGIVNLVSKAPEFTPAGEASLRYGSFDRKEALFDLTGPVAGGIAARIVGRVRDAGTQVDHIPDDRVMIAPSVMVRPAPRTSITLSGLYQEDDGGPTTQFLPISSTLGYNQEGTIRPNPNGELPFSTFVGEPGFDRFDGRTLQGAAMLEQGFGDAITLRSRARYIDANVDYLSHYPNSYANPIDPWLPGTDQSVIRRFISVNHNRIDVFSTDNSLQFDVNTGAAVHHTLLAGVDYQWNRTRVRSGSGVTSTINLYDIRYGNLVLPTVTRKPDVVQKQIGVYLQDQVRFFDRVSVVLGVRRDHATSAAAGQARKTDDATTFRAGIIGELAAGISPFFSYTESFLPVAGANGVTGELYRPETGTQYELGAKWQPDRDTLVTLTGYRIRNANRLVSDPANPLVSIQTGEATSRGIELEGVRSFAGAYDLIVNYSYTKAVYSRSSNIRQIGQQFENVPRHNASIWGTRTFRTGQTSALKLGAGVRYVGESLSYGFVRTSITPLDYALINTIRTPDVTLVDALAQIDFGTWRFAINANNLLGKNYYAACLARGDCFNGARRNVFGTATFRF